MKSGRSARETTNAAPLVGVVESFRPGEEARVEQVLADLRLLGVRELRTSVSWADWCTPNGEQWYNWLLPRLSREVNLLPCFHYTPPGMAIAGTTSAPPRVPKAYADFLDLMITRFGQYFDWVELWKEPGNPEHWDRRLDPQWWIFSEMIGGAAYWVRQRGKKTVLAGMCPTDPEWLQLLCERGVMAYVDAVGIQGPGPREAHLDEWPACLKRVRAVLESYGSDAQLWVTETGYSTAQHDERGQLRAFVKAMTAPVERVYWYSASDLQSTASAADATEPADQFGLKRVDGTPKLLFRLWARGGLHAVREAAWIGEPVRLRSRAPRPVLITGGAGFIGTNLAHRLLQDGRPVLLLDNLSRPGVERNLQWLRETHGEGVQIEGADIRDAAAVGRAVRNASQVFHFAAQVAVTTSLRDAMHDFDVNARGTLTLLEAIRALAHPPPLVFTSTNKVYGALSDVKLRQRNGRYEPEHPQLRARGLGEDRPLDFHSPYGCSKGAADQYVLDYAHTFGLPAVVFRMSCIYGPHQLGCADQGWVAHFLIRALEGQPLTICGDGRQVRDVLHVEDLVEAFLLAQQEMSTLAGCAFNIGGGTDHTISLIELLDLIAELGLSRPALNFESWRPADQRYYVSNTTRFSTATGWKPHVDVRVGVKRLAAWLADARDQEAEALAGRMAS
jgi:CDP-paratose 2-epimerase